MTKYMKIPVIIEAEIFDPERSIYDGLARIYCDDPDVDSIQSRWLKNDIGAGPNNDNIDIDGAVWVPYIDTLEGRHYISPGDYIITGIKGERYPCKPDIFELTYEKVEEDEV